MESVGALVLRCVAAGPSEGGGRPGARRGVQADGSDSGDPGWARLPGPDAGSIAPPAGYSLRDGDAVAAAPRPAQGVCRGGPSLTPPWRSCWTASSRRPAGPSSHTLSLSRYCRCRAQETCRAPAWWPLIPSCMRETRPATTCPKCCPRLSEDLSTPCLCSRWRIPGTETLHTWRQTAPAADACRRGGAQGVRRLCAPASGCASTWTWGARLCCPRPVCTCFSWPGVSSMILPFLPCCQWARSASLSARGAARLFQSTAAAQLALEPQPLLS